MQILFIATAAAMGLSACTFQPLAVPDPVAADGGDEATGGDTHAGDTCNGSLCGDPLGGDSCNGSPCGDPLGGDSCNGSPCGDPLGGDACPSSGCGDAQPGDPGPPPCPDQPPSSTSDCWPPGVTCDYGVDPRIECRTRATCVGGGQWEVVSPTCDALPISPDCKNTVAEMHGYDCTTLGEMCLINDVLCECANCLPSDPVCGGGQVWACYEPQDTSVCPQRVPNLGTACTPEGLDCQYDCATVRHCNGGYWWSGANNCPVSQRQAKRDIEYLAPDQIDALARQVLGIDLATYQYRDPRHGTGDKLGFIIDDQPNLPALTQGGQRVDLYAFSSMLLAALKVQAQQLEALQHQVEALQLRVDAPAAVAAPVCTP